MDESLLPTRVVSRRLERQGTGTRSVVSTTARVLYQHRYPVSLVSNVAFEDANPQLHCSNTLHDGAVPSGDYVGTVCTGRQELRQVLVVYVSIDWIKLVFGTILRQPREMQITARRAQFVSKTEQLLIRATELCSR